MSWGNRVIVILVLFILGMGVMVYISFQQTNEMIDDNYYEKELAYQGIIDAQKNLLNLKEPVTFNSRVDSLQIQFPKIATNNIETGNIEFIRASNKALDKVVPIAVNSDGILSISKTEFLKGLYKVRIKWDNNGVNYYHEQDIIID